MTDPPKNPNKKHFYFNYPNVILDENFSSLTLPALSNLQDLCTMLEIVTSRLDSVGNRLSEHTGIDFPHIDEMGIENALNFLIPNSPVNEVDLVALKSRAYHNLELPKTNDLFTNERIFNAGYNDWMHAMFLVNIEQTTLLYKNVERVMRQANYLEWLMVNRFKTPPDSASGSSVEEPPFYVNVNKLTVEQRRAFLSPEKNSGARKSKKKTTPSRDFLLKVFGIRTEEEWPASPAEANGEASENEVEAEGAIPAGPSGQQVPEPDPIDQAEGGEEGAAAVPTSGNFENLGMNEWRAIVVFNIYHLQVIVLKKKGYLQKLIIHCLEQDARISYAVFGIEGRDVLKNAPLPRCILRDVIFPKNGDGRLGIKGMLSILTTEHAKLRLEPQAAAPEPAVVPSVPAPEPAVVPSVPAIEPVVVPSVPAAEVVPTPVENGNPAVGGCRRKMRESRRPDSLINPSKKSATVSPKNPPGRTLREAFMSNRVAFLTKNQSVPVASPAKSQSVPVASPAKSQSVPVASPAKSQSVPVASPAKSQSVPVASPAKSQSVPVASPAKSQSVPVASPAKSQSVPVASPAKSQSVPVASPAKSQSSPVALSPGNLRKIREKEDIEQFCAVVQLLKKKVDSGNKDIVAVLAQLNLDSRKITNPNSVQPVGTSSRKPPSTCVPLASRTRVPQALGISVPQASGISVPQASGISVPQASGTSVPQASGISVPQASGTSVPQASGTSVPQASGTSAPKTSGTGAAKTSGTGAAKTSGTGAAKTSGTGAAKTSGTGAAKTSGTGAAKTSGTGAAKTSGTGAPKTSGTGAPKTTGTGPPKTSGTGPPKTSGTGPPKTSGTGPPKTSGTGPPKTSGTGPPKTTGTGPPKTLGTGAPKTLGTGAPKTLGTGAPKTLGTGAPKTLGTGAPKTSGTNTAQPGTSTSGDPPKLTKKEKKKLNKK